MGEQQKEVINTSKKVELGQRTDTTVIIQALLRPEQINWFKNELEELKKKALNASDEEIIEIMDVAEVKLPLVEKEETWFDKLSNKFKKDENIRDSK